MPLFSYIARDERGRIDRGTMEAISEEGLRESLRKKNLTVEEVLALKEEVIPVVDFSPAMPWTTTDDIKEERKTEKEMIQEEKAYIPLVETLRLFAGWLLAWYGAVYVLGGFQLEHKLPVEVPFLEALFTSPLVLRFTFGTFLFLLMTSIHRWMGRGVGKAITLTLTGVLMFVLFHLNA
jgi:hypothetical protein